MKKGYTILNAHLKWTEVKETTTEYHTALKKYDNQTEEEKTYQTGEITLEEINYLEFLMKKSIRQYKAMFKKEEQNFINQKIKSLKESL